MSFSTTSTLRLLLYMLVSLHLQLQFVCWGWLNIWLAVSEVHYGVLKALTNFEILFPYITFSMLTKLQILSTWDNTYLKYILRIFLVYLRDQGKNLYRHPEHWSNLTHNNPIWCKRSNGIDTSINEISTLSYMWSGHKVNLQACHEICRFGQLLDQNAYYRSILGIVDLTVTALQCRTHY